MITADKEKNPYIADGKCAACSQWFCSITLDERKTRNGVCIKCQSHIKLTYRTLIVNDIPLICPFCGKDPVFLEQDGMSTFHLENGKVVPHPCDLAISE